ncbi:hypothetical protein PIB30_066667 [Stylosanthes scabra]|uniref:Uncharacterized protein n=1 Tax=Stylosanthes scabra TaxID=79078 RepID=A0ABU6WMC9_9FABA|nr:hypothetical protein [Stylosanthes scabra]
MLIRLAKSSACLAQFEYSPISRPNKTSSKNDLKRAQRRQVPQQRLIQTLTYHMLILTDKRKTTTTSAELILSPRKIGIAQVHPPPFLEGLKHIPRVRVEAELYLSRPSTTSPPKELTSSSLS